MLSFTYFVLDICLWLVVTSSILIILGHFDLGDVNSRPDIYGRVVT